MWRLQKLSGGTSAYITVYVDDMYITTNDSEWLAGFRKRMDKLAPHKSLGDIDGVCSWLRDCLDARPQGRHHHVFPQDH